MKKYCRFIAVTAVACVATVSVSVPSSVAAERVSSDVPSFPVVDYAALQWHLAAVNVSQAWSVTTGAGVTVAVIDSGLNVGSAEFAGRVVFPARVTKNLTVVADPALTDSVGHGTHVAGIIGAGGEDRLMTGVAPSVKIMPINITDAVDKKADALTAMEIAIDYAVHHGARVINMSVGTEVIDLAHSPEAVGVCKAVKDAAAAGVVVVVSAGNDGVERNALSVPAACPGTLSVAAVDAQFRPTYWSSSDATVTVAAPGESIVSLFPSSGPGSLPSGLPVGAASGTSMAAPIVSGVAALVVSVHPDWSSAQVREAVEQSALDVFIPGRDSLTGYGVVDAAKAVGVSAGSPSRQNVLSVLVDSDSNFAELGYDECGVCAYVSWRVLQVPVQYYQVDVVSRDGSVVSSQYGGQDVRAMLTGLREGDWVVVSAVLPDGTRVGSVPTWVEVRGNGEEYRSTVKMRWVSQDTVKVSWTVDSASEWKAVELVLSPYGVATDSLKDIVNVKLDSSRSGSTLVRVPSRLTGFSLTTYVKWRTPDGGAVEAFAPVLNPNFPAHVEVVPAGEGQVGIVGYIASEMSSQDSPAGLPVRVVMAGGETYSTSLLGNGLFSVTVPEKSSGKYRFTVIIGSGKQQVKHDFVLPVEVS